MKSQNTGLTSSEYKQWVVYRSVTTHTLGGECVCRLHTENCINFNCLLCHSTVSNLIPVRLFHRFQ